MNFCVIFSSYSPMVQMTPMTKQKSTTRNLEGYRAHSLLMISRSIKSQMSNQEQSRDTPCKKTDRCSQSNIELTNRCFHHVRWRLEKAWSCSIGFSFLSHRIKSRHNCQVPMYLLTPESDKRNKANRDLDVLRGNKGKQSVTCRAR
jgi:hypothetical protein